MVEDFKLLLSCEVGSAPFVKRELELRGIGSSFDLFDSCVVVSGCSRVDLVRAAYLLQTPLRVSLLLSSFSVSPVLDESISSFKDSIKDVSFKELLSSGFSFFVSSSRLGVHDFNSVDFSESAALVIRKLFSSSGFSLSVDMKNPDVLFFFHIFNDSAWFGIDLRGKPPAKRPYKVFNNPHGIKGPVASSLLMASGWSPGSSLLDPFAGDGVIPVEAALFSSNTSVYFFDKLLSCRKLPFLKGVFDSVVSSIDDSRSDSLNGIFSFDSLSRNVTAAKKNAKIAGVDKFISFSRTDLDWLDTHFSAKSVDFIVTHPLEASKHVSSSFASKLFSELFYAADYLLSDSGSLTFLVHKPEDLLVPAEKYAFVVSSRFLISTGKQPVWILVFVKKNKNS